MPGGEETRRSSTPRTRTAKDARTGRIHTPPDLLSMAAFRAGASRRLDRSRKEGRGRRTARAEADNHDFPGSEGRRRCRVVVKRERLQPVELWRRLISGTTSVAAETKKAADAAAAAVGAAEVEAESLGRR